MVAPHRPPDVNWDVTYACPLRCAHCYSESGRRASRQLETAQLLRVADALVSLRVPTVQLSGGEPLLVKGLFQVAERLSQAGIEVSLYTSGWRLEPEMIPEMFRLFSHIHISVDGTTAAVHDALRGRAGSFQRAMRALTLLDEAARRERERGGKSIIFGTDCAVVRSNFSQLESFCSVLAPRFPELKFLFFGAAIPSGLGSRQGFAEHELLTDEQLRQLGSPAFSEQLLSLCPEGVQVRTVDGFDLQLSPERFESGRASSYLMQVEPDGQVRGMPIYEGTVGNLLTEPAQEVWERAFARPNDPFVVQALAGAKTMQDWARAARLIDLHFGSEEVRARIARRPEYPSPLRPPITRLEPAQRWETSTRVEG